MPVHPRNTDRLAALAVEVEELRGRVARLEAARRQGSRAQAEPQPPPRVLSLDDPDPAKDEEFTKPLKTMPQLGVAKAPWPD